jgi:hypothetical protein
MLIGQIELAASSSVTAPLREQQCAPKAMPAKPTSSIAHVDVSRTAHPCESARDCKENDIGRIRLALLKASTRFES